MVGVALQNAAVVGVAMQNTAVVGVAFVMLFCGAQFPSFVMRPHALSCEESQTLSLPCKVSIMFPGHWDGRVAQAGAS